MFATYKDVENGRVGMQVLCPAAGDMSPFDAVVPAQLVLAEVLLAFSSPP